MHSMEPRERELALEVLSVAWQSLDRAGGATMLSAIRAAAAALPTRHADVSDDFAEHIAAAAVWYLDRATRRVGDPDRDGLTPAQQHVNLARFNSTASDEDIERLFAVATALNHEDV
jgi:hypothetical protein